MSHDTPLIAMIVAGLGLAFIFGVIANRLRLSPLVGYLVAGILIGPFTPGFVADQGLALELAEIGVILLMFGVGLHFSLKDLLSVRAIAIPDAIGQMAVATLLGMALAHAMGWTIGAGILFGLALSVASTVVLLRALQERRLIDTERGRIAVGWLIVEDLAMVLALVLLPGLAGLLGGEATTQEQANFFGLFSPTTVWETLAVTIVKVMCFVALMLIVGRRVIPMLLHYVAHTGSRELFRLAVLAIALGVAFGSASLFDVSFALGAFFAGMVLAESELSTQAAQESLPLRDAFAVLFFVSVGMLFDPSIVVREPWPVLATVAIIVLGKSIAAFLIVLVFGHPTKTALTISASLAQIGEFSFILAGLGVGLKLLPQEGSDLILAGAILSILFNPLLFFLIDRLAERRERRTPEHDAAKAPRPVSTPDDPAPVSSLTDHAILVGYGRVGRLVGEALRAENRKLLVIEEGKELIDDLKAQGGEAIAGSAADPDLMRQANAASARWLISAIPDPFEAGSLILAARKANPAIAIIARAHSAAEVDHLKQFGADLVVMGEQEIARCITARVLAHEGMPEAAAATS